MEKEYLPDADRMTEPSKCAVRTLQVLSFAKEKWIDLGHIKQLVFECFDGEQYEHIIHEQVIQELVNLGRINLLQRESLKFSITRKGVSDLSETLDHAPLLNGSLGIFLRKNCRPKKPPRKKRV